MSYTMKWIRVNDMEALRRVLEDPRAFEEYREFVPGEVVSARVEYYPHRDGAEIRGLPGRYWIYVAVEYRVGESTMRYDIALWKLRNTKLFRELVERRTIDIGPPTEEEEELATY